MELTNAHFEMHWDGGGEGRRAWQPLLRRVRHDEFPVKETNLSELFNSTAFNSRAATTTTTLGEGQWAKSRAGWEKAERTGNKVRMVQRTNRGDYSNCN